jgi:para-nitrobenzyl esterase
MKRQKKRIFGASLLLSAALLMGMASTPMAASESGDNQQGGPVVQTAEGPVRGFANTGVYEFKGIPYAAPPTGELRWRPPQPVAHWQDPLDATSFANTCPQVTTLGVFASPASITEDCLYLNVFTTRLGSGGLPVFVWIHGGGNVDGESNDYDGSKLATGGPSGTPVVVITLNYRLGLFGFLAHPALDSEGHLFANYGIMDIQAVLHWVRRNAAAFGGNPNLVTLGGQSAGATDTGANMISPLSKGLFHRAIFESSPLSSLQPLPNGLTNGTHFASAAGCPGSDATAATCLRALTAPQILQFQGTANANGPYVTGPMVDGSVIPVTPITAWTTGAFNHMPVMGGNVQDEGNFGIGNTEYFTGPPQVPITAAQYIANVTAAYSGPEYPGGPNYPAGTADQVLAKYPPGSNPQATYDLVTTYPGACRNRHIDALWAQAGLPVYEYEFNDQNAPYYYPPMPGFTPLAAHTIDIQFLFPLWHGGILGVSGATQSPALTPQESILSDELVATWTKFAQRGNPNGTGNSPWPRFVNQEGVPEYLSENVPSLSTFTNADFSVRHDCDFWDKIIVYQP